MKGFVVEVQDQGISGALDSPWHEAVFVFVFVAGNDRQLAYDWAHDNLINENYRFRVLPAIAVREGKVSDKWEFYRAP